MYLYIYILLFYEFLFNAESSLLLSMDTHAGIMDSRWKAKQNVSLVVLNIKEFTKIYCTNFHTKENLFLCLTHALQNLSIHKILLFTESLLWTCFTQ